MQRLLPALLCLVVALLPTCKPRGRSSLRSSGLATCTPSPYELLFKPFNPEFSHVRYFGYTDEETLNRARAFLTKTKSEKMLEDKDVMIGEAFGSSPGSDPEKKEWLIIYANEKLIITNLLESTSSANKYVVNFHHVSGGNKYVINYLHVKVAAVSPNSADLHLITGKNGEEALTIHLAGLAVHGPDAGSVRIGDESQREAIKRFLGVREQTMKDKSVGTFNRSDLVATITDYNGKLFPDSLIERDRFRYNRTNFFEGFHFIWKDGIPPRQEWPRSQFAGVPETAIYDPVNQLNKIIGAEAFKKGSITALATAPERRIEEPKPIGAYKRTYDQLYIATYFGQGPQRGANSGNVREVQFYSSSGGLKTLYSENSKDHPGPLGPITSIAVSQGKVKRIAIADENGYSILTKEYGKGYRIHKRFNQSNVVDIRFLPFKGEDPYISDRLLVTTKNGEGKFAQSLLYLERALGPTLIGRHKQPAADKFPFWKFTEYDYSSALAMNNQTPYREKHWSDKPKDDKLSVYATSFLPDCTAVLSGGPDGKLWKWDLTNLKDITADGLTPSLVQADQGHKNRITNLVMSRPYGDGNLKNNNYLLSTSSDGTSKLWKLKTDKNEDIKKTTIEFAKDIPATKPVTAAAFTPNLDGVVIGATTGNVVIQPTGEAFGKDGGYVGLDARAIDDAFIKTNGNALYTGIAPMPGKDSAVLRPYFEADPNDGTATKITNSVFISTLNGGLYTVNLKDGGLAPVIDPLPQDAKTPAPSVAKILNLTISTPGEWVIASQGNGLVERRFNGKITNTTNAIPDASCLAESGVDYKTSVEAVDYYWHVGPVAAAQLAQFNYVDDSSKGNGLVSVGADGTLATWNFRHDCSKPRRAPPPIMADPRNPVQPEPPQYVGDQKLRNVYYSNHYLTSVDVSFDYNYAVTGTLDGSVLLWWIAEEFDVETKN